MLALSLALFEYIFTRSVLLGKISFEELVDERTTVSSKPGEKNTIHFRCADGTRSFEPGYTRGPTELAFLQALQRLLRERAPPLVLPT